MNRAIPGWEGYYEVTPEGRVWSVRSARLLRPTVSKMGYETCSLFRNNIGLTKKVHRLVAEAFWGLGRGRHVNHINGVKRDNRPENLEWVTPAENNRHARETGLHPDTTALSPESRSEITALYRKRAASVTELAGKHGVCTETVRRALSQCGALRPRWPDKPSAQSRSAPQNPDTKEGSES